ncbi:hypothetical protein F7725_018388, partial [Dissostichus mawsoni]
FGQRLFWIAAQTCSDKTSLSSTPRCIETHPEHEEHCYHVEIPGVRERRTLSGHFCIVIIPKEKVLIQELVCANVGEWEDGVDGDEQSAVERNELQALQARPQPGRVCGLGCCSQSTVRSSWMALAKGVGAGRPNQVTSRKKRSASSATLALLGVLSLDAAWASTTVWRPQGEVDVLLAVQANHKGGDDTGMVDALGESKLEDLCLQPPLHEIFNLQAQDVIELHLTLIEYADPHQTRLGSFSSRVRSSLAALRILARSDFLLSCERIKLCIFPNSPAPFFLSSTVPCLLVRGFCAMLSSPTVILQPYGLPGGPGQEAGPGSGDPNLSQVYAPPPSYPPPGQCPPTSAGRLPLEFTSAHPGSEYAEHPQLRIYQGPQLEGPSNAEDGLAAVNSDPLSVSSGGGAGDGSDEEGSNKAQPKRLHVSNIPFRFRDPDLRQMFGQFGTILDVEIIFNERGSKGFGFVTFESAGEADRAREKLNGTIVEGRKIEVNNATARVVTKKPQTPLVNSEIPPSGWKMNPVMQAMYAPELYTVYFLKPLTIIVMKSPEYLHYIQKIYLSRFLPFYIPL